MITNQTSHIWFAAPGNYYKCFQKFILPIVKSFFLGLCGIAVQVSTKLTKPEFRPPLQYDTFRVTTLEWVTSQLTGCIKWKNLRCGLKSPWRKDRIKCKIYIPWNLQERAHSYPTYILSQIMITNAFSESDANNPFRLVHFTSKNGDCYMEVLFLKWTCYMVK